MPAFALVELETPATRAVSYASALRFLARLDARLFEVPAITQSLDQPFLIEHLFKALEPALDGFALLELKNDCHFSHPLSTGLEMWKITWPLQRQVPQEQPSRRQ